MKRQKLLIVAFTAILGVFAASCSSSGSSSGSTAEVETTTTTATPVEPVNVKLGLDWTWLAYHMAFVYAQDQGYYEEAGINLEILEGQGSGTTVKLVATGELDFGFADSSAMVSAVSEGADIRNVSLIWQQANFGTVCDPKANVRSPKDLEGKSVLLIPSENVSAVWPVFLTKNGVDASKITVQAADYSNKITLMVSKKADCMAGVIGQDIQFVLYERPEITPSDIMKWADFDTNAPGHGIVASNKYILENKETVKGFVDASIKGWKAICADTQIGVDLYKTKFPDAPEGDLQFAIDNLPYECSKTTLPGGGEAFGPTDEKLWQDLIDTQVTYGGMKNPPLATAVFTNDFIG